MKADSHRFKKATAVLNSFTTIASARRTGYLINSLRRGEEIHREERDTMSLADEVDEGLAQLGRLNYSHIVIVPKKEGAEEIGSLRPIASLNSNILKVLANRLNPLLPLLVEEYHRCFILVEAYLMG